MTGHFLVSLLQDIRYALRNLRRAPVFTLVSVLSIAGGLAAGTGIFALAYGVVYRPLGVGDGRELYSVFTSNRSGGDFGSVSYADFLDFRESPVIASACAALRARATIAASGTAAMHQGAIVDPGCFEALRLLPATGRFFTAAEAAGMGGPVPIVIGHQMWQQRFAADPETIGRIVALNGMSVFIAAVAPPGFAGLSLDGGAEFWAPPAVAPVVIPEVSFDGRGYRTWRVYARLRPGVERAEAEAALAVVAARLREADPEAWIDATGATRQVTVMRETEARFAGAPEATIGILGGAIAAIAVIIAIACLNLSTMLLARGAARTRELAVRLAVGASRGRVLRQLATESLVIAALGAALAVGTVSIAARLFDAYRPSGIPAFDLGLDWRVLLFTLLITMIAALLCGMAPALHSLRIALAEGLKGGMSTARVRRSRFGPRDALIVVQVAVSSALLLVSTLFADALARGTPASPGFAVQGIAAAEAHLDAIAASELPAVNARLLEAATRVPDLDGVTASVIIPMTGSNAAVRISTGTGEERSAYINVVAPGYFSTLGIPLRVGRDFTNGDTPSGARAIVVSELMAERTFGTTNALGRTILIDSVPNTVVGVVADIRYLSLSQPPTPLIYLPLAQRPQDRIIIHARYRGGSTTLAELERVLRETDPRAAVESSVPMASRMEAALIGERATQLAGAVVGVVQLFLALMALWGLVAYAVERRMIEFGVRLALGATPSSLVRLTMRPAAVLVTIGVVVGTVGGVAIARIVQSASVGLAPLDLAAVLPVAMAFAAVALVAAWWPARRAGSADPAESLRRE